MLDQHRFYVYYEENRVMARMDKLAPVVAETCKTPQDAHDKVQTIVNPRGLKHDAFGPKGFHDERFQNAISTNCEAFVKAAYAAAKK